MSASSTSYSSSSSLSRSRSPASRSPRSSRLRSPSSRSVRSGAKSKKRSKQGSSDERRCAASVVSRLADIERRVVRHFRRALCGDRDALTEHVAVVQRALIRALTATGDLLQMSLPLQKRYKSGEVGGSDLSVPSISDEDIGGLLHALGRDDLSKRLLTAESPVSGDSVSNTNAKADNNADIVADDVSSADTVGNGKGEAADVDERSCESTEMFYTDDVYQHDKGDGDVSPPNQCDQSENAAAESKAVQFADAETNAVQSTVTETNKPQSVTASSEYDNICPGKDSSDEGNDRGDDDNNDEDGSYDNDDDDDTLTATVDKATYDSHPDLDRTDLDHLIRQQNEEDRRLLADSDSEIENEGEGGTGTRHGDDTASPIIGLSRSAPAESLSAGDDSRARRRNAERVNYKETIERSAAQRKKRAVARDTVEKDGEKKLKKRVKSSDAFSLEECGDSGGDDGAISPASDSHVDSSRVNAGGGGRSGGESGGDGDSGGLSPSRQMFSSSSDSEAFTGFVDDVLPSESSKPAPPSADEICNDNDDDDEGDVRGSAVNDAVETIDIEEASSCRVLVSPLPERVLELCRDGRLRVTRKKRGHAYKHLSAMDRKINRLMNIDLLLKAAPSSNCSDSDNSTGMSDSDTENTGKKREIARKRSKKSTSRPDRLKDVSDADSSSDSDTVTERRRHDSSPARSQFALSQDRNEFDKQRILNSDSSEGDDDRSSSPDRPASSNSRVQSEDGDAGASESPAEKNAEPKKTTSSKNKSTARRLPAHVRRLLNASLDVTDSSEEDAAMFDKYQQDKTKESKYDAAAGVENMDDDVTSQKSEDESDSVPDVVTASDSVVVLSGTEDGADTKPLVPGVKDEIEEVKQQPDSGSDEDFHKKRTPMKRRLRALVDSDSDVCVVNGDEESDTSPQPKSSKRRRKDEPDAANSGDNDNDSDNDSNSGSDSSASDSGDDFVPEKKSGRRKRVTMPSDESSVSDDSSVIIEDDDNDVEDEDDDGEGGGGKKNKGKTEKSPLKAGRKNIRNIRVADFSTKQASQAEQARKHRIEEKQKMYNQLFNQTTEEEGESSLERLILDFDLESKSALVSVHKNFVKVLKPHQVEGVKFMFDSTVETVEQLNDEGENESGGGCILAHCMGLGKTLQVIVLLHTLLQSSATKERICTALVICPKSTVQNWVRELKQWQRKCRVPTVDVVDITFRKDNHARSFALHEWLTEGGVCVLSYDMYKRLCGTGGKKGYNRKQLDRFQQSLVDPGPDIIICDEGHLLKNPKTATFKSLNQVKTMRRVILTGTPLQNNLREYHTMVEFVKPKLLGSESEFSNRFIRPIENGSAVDALPRDVRLMKRRSHVLHKLLDGVVQRRDYNVLTPFLPAKHEYVLMVRLCDVQRQLYTEYLRHHAKRNKQSRGILSDFQALSRIWTHPRSIQLKDERNVEEDKLKGERKAMRSFINDGSDSDSSASDSDVIVEPTNGNAAPSDNIDWWKAFIPDDVSLDSVELGGKLALLLQVLIKCETIGDKVLVFSQSLFSLDLIEEHLKRLHAEIARCRRKPEVPGEKHPADVYFGTWRLDYDYFRLDGSVPEDRRQMMCDKMNRSSDERARLMLISTRAGGLGINLVGANRVVIFDASWNPTADSQAIFRVFRFGQMKPSYIYRFLAQGTMEEKIYDRQITKLSLAGRVVDEQQIERHFNQHDVEELYEFEPDRTRSTGVTVPKDDRLLMELVSEQGKKWVSSVHGHDSLLQNLEDEELNAEEQRAAWEEYENDKKGLPNFSDVIPLVEGHSIAKDTVIEMIKRDNPTASDEDVRGMIPKAIQTLRAYYLRRQQQQRAEMEMNYRQMVAMQHMAQLSALSGLPNLPRGTSAMANMPNQRYNALSANALRSAAALGALRPSAASLMRPGASSVRPGASLVRPGTTGVNLSHLKRSGLSITPAPPTKK